MLTIVIFNGSDYDSNRNNKDYCETNEDDVDADGYDEDDVHYSDS